MDRPWILCLALAVVCLGGAISTARAAERGPANVPPTLEIEVLDPNADPLGRPAVELRHEDGAVRVDIPPAVLVHRYYYSGDRSFQAQLLPGGPCVVVASHPKTGERCYINVQMMPGAPRVTYTGHSIQYDYGDHGITVHFGLLGQPTVKYRSGETWTTKAGKVVHAEQLKDCVHQIGGGVKRGVTAGSDSFHEAVIDTEEMLKTATLPLQNLARMLPLGTAMFDPDRARMRDEKIAQHRREKEIKHAEQEKIRNDQTYRTNR